MIFLSIEVLESKSCFLNTKSKLKLTLVVSFLALLSVGFLVWQAYTQNVMDPCSKNSRVSSVTFGIETMCVWSNVGESVAFYRFKCILYKKYIFSK